MTDERGVRIEKKLDKISDHISSIDVTLASQHISLKEHMRRTEMLERQIEPVQKHVAMIQGALKLIGLMALCVGIVEGGIKILTFIGSK